MIRTRTLLAGAFGVLLFLLPAFSPFAHAQAAPCDNSQTTSVTPAKKVQIKDQIKNRPLMPEEIQADPEIMEKLKAKRLRLTAEDIRRCLKSNKPLKNHVIDFDEYVAAWREIKYQKPSLLIEDSVLWSFKKKAGKVNLAAFARDTEDDNGTVTRVITGQIQWKNVTLGPSVSAREIEFPPKTSFANSRFPNLANFSNAILGNNADFSMAKFGNDTSFAKAILGDYTSFHRATFKQNASFAEGTFGDHTAFALVTYFGNDTDFSDANFGDGTSFNGATFKQNASFANATFGDYASFFAATFGNNADFFMAKFGNDTSFANATFCTDASFIEAIFGGDISLRGAIGKDKLDLSRTTWKGRADFREAVIQDLSWDSMNRPSRVKGVFDAREAMFKKAVFKEIRFSDLVDFSDVEFGGSGESSSDEEITKADSCERDDGKSPPEQSEQEPQELIFQNLTFDEDVDFLRATFRNDAIFIRNHFKSTWKLNGVNFERKKGQEEQKNPLLCLSFNRIGKLFMEREHLGYGPSWPQHFITKLLPLTALQKSRVRSVTGDSPYSCSDFLNKSREDNEELWKIYAAIEASFREENDRLAENEAWYLGLVAHKESQYSKLENWEFLIVIEYWASLIFADFPSRYGIDLYRVVLMSVSLILFFATIYCCYFLAQIHVYKWKLKVHLKPLPDQKRAFRFRPFERFFQSREKQVRPLHPLKDALFLSGRMFFKLGLGTAYPRTLMLAWIVHVEWIAGMYMLIHFLLAVRNTLPIAVPLLAATG